MIETDSLEVTYIKKNVMGNKTYFEALKNISFKFDGRCLGILGETGSGKTTLAKALAGVVNYKGKLKVDGIEVRTLKKKNMLHMKLQLIFQDPNTSFNPRLRIISQLYDVKKDEEKIMELKSKLGLNTELNKKPASYSGGEKQRLAILRALLKDPSILVFDEPTSSLDAYLKNEFIKIIEGIMKEKTCIIISHDVNVVAKLAEYIMVLKDGQMLEYGQTQKIIKNPENEYTKKLVSFLNAV